MKAAATAAAAAVTGGAMERSRVVECSGMRRHVNIIGAIYLASAAVAVRQPTEIDIHFNLAIASKVGRMDETITIGTIIR